MQVHMVSCRVLAAHGQLSIVLFWDPQPPVVVVNHSGVDTEVDTATTSFPLLFPRLL